MKTIIIVGMLLSMSTTPVFAFSFSEAVEKINKHEAVERLALEGSALKEEGSAKGSWGDPHFKIQAKNFPKDSLKDDETPMTGIEFGLSQKIALSNKYGNKKDSLEAMGEAKLLASGDTKNELLKSLWDTAISQRKLKEEIEILGQNMIWIEKMLKVSKKLYTNGKISQQGLLDIQIRKSEIDSLIENKEFDYKEILSQFEYLLGEGGELDLQTVPWQVLESESEKKDLRELALNSQIKAKNLMVAASKKDFVPDVTVSLGYTKRSDIDNRGDFISAGLSFPLPLSGTKYGSHAKAVYERSAAHKELEVYKKKKRVYDQGLSLSISKIKRELQTLNNKTIKFAENSRKVTAKSYRFGRSSYVELLQSELKLQSLLLKRISLNAQLAEKKIQKRYLLGEKLYE